MKYLGKTADGAVVIDRPHSHLHIEMMEMIPDAISKVHTHNRQFLEVVVEFERIIGESCCVSTSSNDCVIFAQRPNRKGLTRFVIDKDKVPTSKATVVLKQTASENEYVLITAFIGGKAEVEPWDPRATQASLSFWQGHALVWGAEPIVKGTATTECPW